MLIENKAVDPIQFKMDPIQFKCSHQRVNDNLDYILTPCNVFCRSKKSYPYPGLSLTFYPRVILVGSWINHRQPNHHLAKDHAELHVFCFLNTRIC